MNGKRTPLKTSKVKTFLFFLLLAIIFWGLTKFSKEVRANMHANLAFINVPTEVSLSANNVEELSFDVATTGFQMLSYKLKEPTVPIDVSRYYETGDTLLLLSNTELVRLITAKLGNNILVRNTSVDELAIQLDAIATKRVPVSFSSEISFKDGYRVFGDVTLVPDSVSISGPENELAMVKEVKTETFVGNDISEAQTQQLAVIIPEDTSIKSNPNKVSASIDVIEYTQKKLVLPVEVINKEKGITLKLFPETVNVSFEVSIHEFNTISETDFRVVCDFSKKGSDENFLVPKIVTYPKNLYNLELDSKKIDYLIFK